jgi:hypothetical protein
MQRMPMKAFLLQLAAALGAAALLVVCGACEGDPALSELRQPSEVAVDVNEDEDEDEDEDDCAFRLLLDLDLQEDDD